MNKGKILIVEDEFIVAENLRSDVTSMGYDVAGLAFSGQEALRLARQHRPDLVLMDIKLRDGMDGIETAILLRQDLNIPSIFLSAFSDESFLERAKCAEPLGYMVKPFERDRLRAGIEIAHHKARMERLLKESETRFRSMFENSPVAYLALDDCNRCLDLNAEFCRLLGYEREEIRGKNLTDFCPPDKRDASVEQLTGLKNNRSLHAELELVHKDTGLLTVIVEGRVQPDAEGQPFRMHCIVDNITDQKRLEEERLQFERRIQHVKKTESLSCMAGAIAHNFNNLLAIVMGNLELAIENTTTEGRSSEYLNDAMQASMRAADISGLMLTYLGQIHSSRAFLDLSAFISKNIAQFKGELSQSADIQIEIPPPGLVIKADADLLRDILTNLITNARESIGESQGIVRLSVKKFSRDGISMPHRFPFDWQPIDHSYACIAIEDSGCGIADENIDKLFDPFFSSKFTGRGLGLPVVLGIVKAHEGVVTVESEIEKGSIFRVFLPIAANEQF